MAHEPLGKCVTDVLTTLQPRPQGLLAFQYERREDPGDEVDYTLTSSVIYY